MNSNRPLLVLAYGYAVTVRLIVLGLLGVVFAYGVACYYASWMEGLSVNGVSGFIFGTAVLGCSGISIGLIVWAMIDKLKKGSLLEGPGPLYEIYEDGGSAALILAAIPATIFTIWGAVIAFCWVAANMPYFDTIVTAIAYIVGGLLFLAWLFLVPPADHTEGPY